MPKSIPIINDRKALSRDTHKVVGYKEQASRNFSQENTDPLAKIAQEFHREEPMTSLRQKLQKERTTEDLASSKNHEDSDLSTDN